MILCMLHYSNMPDNLREMERGEERNQVTSSSLYYEVLLE
jgi:hypothetical protein